MLVIPALSFTSRSSRPSSSTLSALLIAFEASLSLATNTSTKPYCFSFLAFFFFGSFLPSFFGRGFLAFFGFVWFSAICRFEVALSQFCSSSTDFYPNGSFDYWDCLACIAESCMPSDFYFESQAGLKLSFTTGEACAKHSGSGSQTFVIMKSF